MPDKNPFTDAIESIVGEIDSLVKNSKKKGNQTPVVHGGFKSEEIIRKALASKGLSLDEFRRPM